MALTPQQCAARAEIYLEHAAAALQVHHAAHRRSVEAGQHSESALKRLLTNLLGSEFNYLAARGRLPGFQRYCGTAPGERGTDDHVVPLALIVGHLARNPALAKTKNALRTFLQEHLVMAYIPVAMNARLARSTMPNELWHRSGLATGAKLNAIWGRYLGATPPIARPGSRLSGVVEWRALDPQARRGGHHP